jgi:hypothetical protein
MTTKWIAFRKWARLAAIVILTAASQYGSAQLATTTATLGGAITDPSNAEIPQATVTLTAPEKGITRVYTTEKGGRYLFNQLPPATYSLKVKAKGFKEYKQDGITLDAGQSASQDIVMPIGTETEIVSVTSQAPLMNTSNANISADISGKEIVELPLNTRNIYGLTELNSSVNNGSQRQVLLGGGGSSTDNADQDVSFFNFGGGFFGSTGFLLDGVWDTGADWGAAIYVPSVDTVQEFKVQAHSFTAQYGWSTGNVIDVVTKSGTNAFHGSAYEFYRNSALDANEWFNNYNGLPKESFSRNQYGVSAGGPLYIPGLYRQREKTFVYGVYEHLSLATPVLATATVPDANFRAGNFAELLGSRVGTDALGRPIVAGQVYNPHSVRAITAGQIDPKTGLVSSQTGFIRDPIANNNVAALGPLNPLAVQLLSYYPTATTSGLSNNYTNSATAPAKSNEYSIRVDHNLTDATRFFMRYSYKSEFKTGTPTYWGANDPAGPGNIRPNNRYNIASGFSHVFTPTLTMNLAAGLEHWGEVSTNQSLGFKPSSLGLPSYLDANSDEFPLVSFGGQTEMGPTGGSETRNIRPTGSVAADFIKVINKHTVSMGWMGVESQFNQPQIYQSSLNFNGTFTQGPDPENPTADTGNGVAEALLGVLDGGSTGASYAPAITKRYLGWYVQDDYKLNPAITLNLGLRYEIQTGQTFRHNAAASFDATATNPIGSTIGQTLPGALIFASSSDRALYNTNYKNIAPRFGFSAQINPKLVIRGGYGIFYPPSLYPAGATTDGFGASTQIVSTLDGITPNPAVTTANPWPQGFVAQTGNAFGELQDVGYSVTSNFRSRPATYVEQYAFGIQYALTPNDVIEVGYVGNHGIHMLNASISASQLDPKYLSLGTNALNHLVANPFYGAIAPGKSGCGLDTATVPYYRTLVPFPQYCSVTQNDPAIGFSKYNALQATYNHRFNTGLNVLVSYTYSKFIDNVGGTNSWSTVGNSSPANAYNMAAEKSIDGTDVPQSLVASYVYELPIGRGKRFASKMNRATDAVVGGWQISGVSTFKNGTPIAIAGSNITSYGGNPRPNETGNVHVSNPSIHEWFNTAAFSYASYGTFGNVPRFISSLRSPGYQNWDIALLKNWRFKEAMRIQFRAETFNSFNHGQFYTPNESYSGCDPNASSSCNSSFGQITNAFPSREVQIGGKFYW